MKTRIAELDAACKFQAQLLAECGLTGHALRARLAVLEPLVSALEAEQKKDAEDMLRLIETVKYLQGIAERGEGRVISADETVEAFVLGYVKNLEAENQRLREALKAWYSASEHTHDCAGLYSLDPLMRKCDCWIKEPCRLTAEALKEKANEPTDRDCRGFRV